MDLLKQLMQTLTANAGGGGRLYDALRSAAARLDYEVAYQIDGLRKHRQRTQRLNRLDQELTSKIQTFRDLSATAPPQARPHLQTQASLLQDVLTQLRRANSGTQATTGARHPGPSSVGERVDSIRTAAAGMAPARGNRVDRSSGEIPISNEDIT